MKNNLYEITNDVPGQTEEQLQSKIVYWFHNTYPDLRGCLFAIPNGALRTKRQGKMLKQTGVIPGVSDLILLVNSKAYLIELKKKGGRQSIKQASWELLMRREGFTYIIVDSLKDFKAYIESILSHRTP